MQPSRSRTSRLASLGLAVGLLAMSSSPTMAVSVPGAPNCPIFPANNVWNERVDTLPVRSDSARMVASIGLGRYLHPDFGSYAGYGIPYNIVSAATPRSVVKFQYANESDKGPYPIPANVKIEAGSDGHILLVDRDACTLYELFAAHRVNGAWKAGSGAIWDLRSNALRPAGWTSADAAGLPILPGMVRWNEVEAGVISHALRFTASSTRTEYLYPARHQAGDSGSTSLPPMGLRVRLKKSVDISSFGPQAQVVLRALQQYGMILADNGSPWFVSGASNRHFDDDDLHQLQQITGKDFEVVDTTNLRNG